MLLAKLVISHSYFLSFKHSVSKKITLNGSNQKFQFFFLLFSLLYQQLLLLHSKFFGFIDFLKTISWVFFVCVSFFINVFNFCHVKWCSYIFFNFAPKDKYTIISLALILLFLLLLSDTIFTA